VSFSVGYTTYAKIESSSPGFLLISLFRIAMNGKTPFVKRMRMCSYILIMVFLGDIVQYLIPHTFSMFLITDPNCVRVGEGWRG